MNVLFICSQARMRSFTARQLAIAGGLDAECAGTDSSARIKVNLQLLEDADFIFCMEKKHRTAIQKLEKDAGLEVLTTFDASYCHTLNIQDIHNPLDPHLCFELIQKIGNINKDIAFAMRAGAIHFGIKPKLDPAKLLAAAGW